MRSSYGGPGSSRSTWKPAQDPGKQAPAATTHTQTIAKNNSSRPGGNAQHTQSGGQQHSDDEKKE